MSLFDRLKKTTPKNTAAPAKAASSVTKKSAKADAKKKPAADQKATQVTPGQAQAARVLLRPVVTEKATLTGTYLFEVASGSTKSEIKKAIRAIYNVTPKHVRVMTVIGKQKRWGAQGGQRKGWKKAIVRLKDGETINVYDAV